MEHCAADASGEKERRMRARARADGATAVPRWCCLARAAAAAASQETVRRGGGRQECENSVDEFIRNYVGVGGGAFFRVDECYTPTYKTFVWQQAGSQSPLF